MYFSESITLRSFTLTQGSYGEPIETAVDVTCFANVKSVGRTEFYYANLNGINAVCEIEIHVEDYGNQTVVVYNSSTYEVIRSYQKGEGIIVLTCANKAV